MDSMTTMRIAVPASKATATDETTTVDATRLANELRQWLPQAECEKDLVAVYRAIEVLEGDV